MGGRGSSSFTKRSGFKKKNQHGQTSLAFD